MKLESKNEKIIIRSMTENDCRKLWEISYNGDLEWMKWNGPYFNDPVYSWEEFKEKQVPLFVDQEDCGVLVVADEIIGLLSWHWEDGSIRRWLEFGIIIYPQLSRGQGIGMTACRLWIDYLFELFSEIQRVGFTTWSGNKAMTRLGEKLQMREEARIRSVRYVNGHYYDSIKYGLLREEWQKQKLQ